MQVRSLGQKIPQRRTWRPSLGFLPGASHGQRSLAGYSPRSHKESDATEHSRSGGLPFSTLGFCYVQIFKQRVLLLRELATHTHPGQSGACFPGLNLQQAQ